MRSVNNVTCSRNQVCSKNSKTPFFFNYLINDKIFVKRLFKIKREFLFSLQILLKYLPL